MTEQPGSDDSTTVLTAVRAGRSDQLAAEIRTVLGVIDWCVLHETDDEDSASFGDHGIPLAGDGAPWVLESAVLELCAALGQSTDAGKRYVGAVLEIRYRLPRTWERVAAGDLPFWRARSIAEQTMCLPEKGAVFVDRHVAHVAHQVSYLQLKRLVEEAQARFDPVEAEKRARAAADGRHISIHTHQVGINGTVDLTGTLDLRDALDLDDALNQGATALGAAGCTESHDVRRSLAAGDLARGQVSLPFDDAGGQESVVPPRSRVVLHVHLSEAALTGDDTVEGCLARVENTRSPIWADRVREWCAAPGVQVIVKPVIDLAEQINVAAYEIPDRLRAQRELIDHHCVFPWCTRPARSSDIDHITPHDQGGTTSTANTAPLCRGHHRAKTHTRWDYDRLDDTTYLWRSPNGLFFRRDHHGTTPITPPAAPPGET
ncbi:HNH endonuclease signature motif containing protein [Nocardioides psychrotolerans]|uniref:HNH endonuclease signature motif containing protein n=1 Tax=Nocardioides psychrotolerans TaxID=1005945 RepID=UPI0031381E34